MKIRLIASDLDGTLLTDKKEIPEINRQALAEAAAAGVQFVPATGRSFSAVPQEVLALPGTEYVITSNGASLYSVSRGKRIYECMLLPETVDRLLKLQKPEDMVMEVFIDGIPYAEQRYVEDPGAFGATEYGIGYVKRTRRPVPDIRRFAKEHREQMDSVSFAGGREETRQAFRRELLEKVPEIYVTSSIPHLLEIGNIRGGKGNTLKKLLELLGISTEEAMSFGDADNDIPMLTAVKYGYAMGNAAEHCKKAAAAVTDTNNQGGVGKAVLKLLGQQA